MTNKIDVVKADAAVANLKATFWRRVAFVYRHGTKFAIRQMEQHFDVVGWGEFMDIKGLQAINEDLTLWWSPIYDAHQNLEKRPG